MLLILTGLYLLCAMLLALYTSGQALLLIQYLRTHKQSNPLPKIDTYPAVTVQLPLYNEPQVAQRLLQAVTELDYPQDRLLIQILDDSTDNTRHLLHQACQYFQDKGFQIEYRRRTQREGFKAGALAEGLASVHSDYVVIFDADFIPPADFLKRTIPYLVDNPQLGFVQTRWGHLNAYDNPLTQAQMLSIDSHFVVEQTARNRSGWLIPFNGTGGVWRVDCIRSAGDWSADTLTEDLDLSYRAQLAGWEAFYLPDVVVPGEIPSQLATYQQQQARWAMGNTQCLIKLAGPVVTSKHSKMQRLMAIQHLCQYLPHPLMFILLLLTPPLLLAGVLDKLPLASLGSIGLAPPLMYAMSQRAVYPSWKRHLFALPYLILFGSGMIWNNTSAVLQAMMGKRKAFYRTPKMGYSAQLHAIDSAFKMELLLTCYALWGTVLAVQMQSAILPYLILYTASFMLMTLWGWRERWQMKRLTATPLTSTRL